MGGQRQQEFLSVATLGMSEVEREAVERLQRDVIEPSMTNIVLLDFWATWCGPCKAEIPHLVELQKEYPNDLVVLGMSVDDPLEKLKPFAEQYKINYPVLVGLERADVQDAFGPLYGIPVTFFIGRDGKICQRNDGIRAKGQLEGTIKALL